MKILGIDTCTDTVDAALMVDGLPAISRRGTAPRRQLTVLVPMISEMLKEAGIEPEELDVIGVTRGPGSFTGIRLGLATAKTISQATGIPIGPVNTIDALTAGCPGDGLVAACLDARKGEVFYGLYRKAGDNVQLQGGYRRAAFDDCVAHLNTLSGENPIIIGTVWKNPRLAFGECLQIDYRTFGDPYDNPRGEVVARLAKELLHSGKTVNFLKVNACYMREFVATPPRPLIEEKPCG